MDSTQPPSPGSMTALERRATGGLAAIFGARMVGLFLILPVFSLYADELSGSTPALIGLAIGAYGLTQALLQIPMGFASDRFGRRPVIIVGLLLFAAGSVLAALSTHIYGVIAGRALQGSGAIAAAVMALAADLTRESQRTKTMAIIGMSIGGAFMLAMMLGPVIANWVGLSGVFWVTAAMAVLAIALLWWLVPVPAEQVSAGREDWWAQFRRVTREPDLLRLDLGIFTLHFILTAGFVVLPIVFEQSLGLDKGAHWQVYVPVLLLSAAAMFPIIALGERRRQMPRVLLGAVAVLALTELALALWTSRPLLFIAAFWVYFTAFNVLEASLPSLVSRVAPPHAKGAALGLYSTAQFAGAFAGGVAGGLVFAAAGLSAVFLLCAVAAVVWFVLTLGFRRELDSDPSS